MKFLSPQRHPDLTQVRQAWAAFLQGHAEPTPPLRPYVLRAWQRSRKAGCDPNAARADRLPPVQRDSLLADQRGFIDVLDPFLQALSRAAGPERHAAMLADADGRLLRLAGDRETVEDENFPQPGALLSEDAAGANGVGTALAESGYVELVGPEHFIEGFHVFTCQGVPLEGPRGEVAGVLSMSVRRLEAADRVRDILFCASEAASCELIARDLAQSAARDRGLERLRQDVMQRVTQARLRLELAARQIAAGGAAHDTLETALSLSRQFERQAALWRDLALAPTGAAQAVDLSDLVEDFLALMQTEARIAGLRFVLLAADRLRVLDDRVTLARRLLSAALGAVQASTPGSTIEVCVGTEEASAVVSFTLQTPAEVVAGHPALSLRVAAPRLI